VTHSKNISTVTHNTIPAAAVKNSRRPKTQHVCCEKATRNLATINFLRWKNSTRQRRNLIKTNANIEKWFWNKKHQKKIRDLKKPKRKNKKPLCFTNRRRPTRWRKRRIISWTWRTKSNWQRRWSSRRSRKLRMPRRSTLDWLEPRRKHKRRRMKKSSKRIRRSRKKARRSLQRLKLKSFLKKWRS